MGESFKLLAQALVGYEDAIESQGLVGYEDVCGSGSTATTSTTSSQRVDLDMEASV